MGVLRTLDEKTFECKYIDNYQSKCQMVKTMPIHISASYWSGSLEGAVSFLKHLFKKWGEAILLINQMKWVLRPIQKEASKLKDKIEQLNETTNGGL